MHSQESTSLHLMLSWKIASLYDKLLDETALAYDLTRNEKDVLLFLHNNPTYDTASDIVKYRCISKSFVAKSVKALQKKRYIQQEPDTLDRRIIHLSLTGEAEDAVKQLRESQLNFFKILDSQVEEDERAVVRKMAVRLIEQIDQYL